MALKRLLGQSWQVRLLLHHDDEEHFLPFNASQIRGPAYCSHWQVCPVGETMPCNYSASEVVVWQVAAAHPAAVDSVDEEDEDDEDNDKVHASCDIHEPLM